jgi:actin-related protein
MTAPEFLFKETGKCICGKTTYDGLHQLVWKSVQGSNIDIRKDLAKNIILSGGTTMYEGLADRLKNEIIALAPAGAQIRVFASADRKFAVWRGASTLSSLSTFESSWITAEDYQEHGAAIVHRKCA